MTPRCRGARFWGTILGLLASWGTAFGQVAESDRPNVLLIMVDDLNDWIGCYEGHPQAETPNLDRLARRGVQFTNAHCAAPLCNPSRAAIFSGCHPLRTGILANDDQDIRKTAPELVLLPEHFAAAGYETLGAGKLLHQSSRGLFQQGAFPHLRWSPFSPGDVLYSDAELPSKGTLAQRHHATLNGRAISLPLNGMPSDRLRNSPQGESFDWGPLPVADRDMGDGQIAEWAAARLHEPRDKPFFLAVGFYRPHIPLFAPQQYFDRLPEDAVVLPDSPPDDLDDLPDFARTIALEADTAGLHASVIRHDQWRAATRAYLACVSFVDSQVGKLLDALDAGPHGRSTIVVLMSDHGWHLGEKRHWGKWTLWRTATRVPLIVALPRGRAGVRHDRPVSLLDVYPTLLDACRLPPRAGLDGRSLLPELRESGTVTSAAPVLCVRDRGNYALIGDEWHFIRYRDGSQELYAATDANQRDNLAGSPDYQAALTKLDQELNERLEAFAEQGGK
ncbi:MAG: sulfatase [Pirellulales bacterium]|nr:sulfatase [Pirellulales bacterium]